MVDGVRTQLFMMLVQQPGSGALPLSNLTPDQFLPFVRRIEENVVTFKLSPIIVFWSSHNASWMLPETKRYQSLIRDTQYVSVFSEECLEKQDEFCFLVHSQGISMILYGHRADESTEGVYQCVGSIDPHVVRRGFQFMMPQLNFIDGSEANRLDDARNKVGNPVTAPHFVSGIRNEWPIVKQRSITGPPAVGAQIEGVILPATGHPIEIVRPPLPAPPSPASNDRRTKARDSVIHTPDSSLTNVVRPGDQVVPPPGAAVEIKVRPESLTPPPSTPISARAGDPTLLDQEMFDFGGLTRTLFAPPSGGSPISGIGTGGSGGGGGGNGSRLVASGAHPPDDDKTLSSAGQRGMKELKEVWTNITQEVRTFSVPDAQRIIRDIISKLRLSSDLHAILQFAIKELARVGRSDRGLIWQVIDDQLVVTNEYSADNNNCFTDSELGAQESTAIVSEFLSRFPDETGSGVIAIPDVRQDTKFRRLSQTLAGLIELGDVRARLVAQIKCRGMFHGFIELQQKGSPRDWTDQDAAILQSVSEVLSLVVQQSYDLVKMELNTNEMKLINEISEIFRESGGQHAPYTIERSLKLFAEHTNFLFAQVFLESEEDSILVPQMTEREYSENVSFSAKNNPFLQVYECGKLKVFNQERSRRGDPFFGHNMAMVIPLMSEGDRFGVLALWKRKEGAPPLRLQDIDLAMTVAGNLASFIRADQAIAQIRAERARASLLNTVSNEVQQSLKDVGPILETLVKSLADFFDLALCVVSIFDPNIERFTGTKSAGDLITEPDSLLPTLGEQLFQNFLPELSDGKIIFAVTQQEVRDALKDTSIEIPSSIKLAMLMPLRQGISMKGALCLMSSKRDKIPSPADMHMLKGLLEYASVVLAHKEVYEQVERQAVTDPMTGLYNRRYFQEQISKEFDRCQRYGRPLSYIIADLDYLKKINDNLGHQFGDAAIKHIAQVLKRCVRDNVDTTARYGGEEFIVLLPETDAEGARRVAERMCIAICEKEVPGMMDVATKAATEGREVIALAGAGRITASIGVCTFPTDTEDREQLSELADQALYLAKHRGRNRVCSVSQDLMPSLKERGEEALHITQEAVKKKTQDLPSINLSLIAEHGILGLLGTVIKMIEERDSYGADRSPRAAEYASRISLALRLSKEHTTVISLSAILNNLGKIAVDEDVLKKKGPLTPAERKMVESSPSMTAKILEPAKHLHRVASVVEAYHEHWDGTGYPKGTKGEDIPLESRIIALVDAYVAMTSDRPYRKALTKQRALEELEAGAGKEWDPRLVKLFLAILMREDREASGQMRTTMRPPALPPPPQ